MNFWGEAVSLVWFVGIIFKSTLLLLILLGLSFVFSKTPAFRHRFLLIGLFGISVLPFFNLFIPPLNLNLPRSLLDISELTPVLNPEVSSTPQFFWLMLISTWFLGTLFLLGRLCLGVHRIQRLTQKSSLMTGSKLQLQLAELQKNLKLERSINLLVSSSINTPMTWGWWKPKVLLPKCALNWSEEQCRMIFLHELAHIKRADWLVQVFAMLIRALYWFNPLVWILTWQLRLEREKACDIKVLTSGVKPSEYASMLLNMAQFHIKTPALMVKTPPLETRLKEILAFKGIKTASKHWHALGIITICSLAVLLGSLNPIFPKPSLLVDNSLPLVDQDKEAAALLWQLMSAQKPELRLASDYEDSTWQVAVSKDNGNTKVALALPNVFSLGTWSDLITSPSVSVSVDSEEASNKIEINPKENTPSEGEKSDSYWL